MSRTIVFTLLGFFLLVIAGPVLNLLDAQMVTIDAPVIIVLYMALVERRPGFARRRDGLRLFSGGIELPGAVTALTLGYVADLLGGGIKGMHCLGLSVLYLVGCAASRHVALVGALSQCLVTLGSSLLVAVVALLVRWATGTPPGSAMVAVVFGQAALTAAMAPVLMKLLRFLDDKLARDSVDRGSLHIG